MTYTTRFLISFPLFYKKKWEKLMSLTLSKPEAINRYVFGNCVWDDPPETKQEILAWCDIDYFLKGFKRIGMTAPFGSETYTRVL